MRFVILSRQAGVILSRQAKDRDRPDRGLSPGTRRILRFAQDDNSLYRDARDPSLRSG
jgi:hypothetical protein